MQKNYILLIISLIFCSNISFSQQYDFITPDNSVPIIDVESLVGESLVVESCTIDSIHVYDNYSVAVLYSTDTSAVSRTIVSDLSLISISKKDWEKVTCKIWITRMHPLMGELNPCETTYFAIASDENGPLYLNTNEQPNCEIYYLDSIECIVNEQVKYHSLEDMYYAAVDAFLTIGRSRQLIAKDVPIYVSSEHFYTPFRMLADKRELPDGMDFCTESDLKKKITIKHPYVYCWYFGTQVHDDTLTIWAWTPYFKKKGANVKGTLCTYYWMIFQYQDDGWVLLNANVSQV